MKIFMVHGFWDTGYVFRRLEHALTAAGHQCFSPTLRPRDGRHGLVDLAGKLAGYIDAQLDGETPFAIVGFSMGCLVARYYLQRLREGRRARAFFAISGPMRGTATAFLYPGKGAHDMRPGSRFLRELEAGSAGLDGLLLRTYYTPLDLMILPATSSRMAGVAELRVWSPLHPLMLVNRRVAADIVRNLEQLPE
jgi:triacylglycerol lipase